MAHDDAVGHVLVVEQRRDVLDVRVEVDRRRQQVGAVGQTGERWRVHVVTSGPEPSGDLLIAPAAVATAVDENEGRGGLAHPPSLSRG